MDTQESQVEANDTRGDDTNISEIDVSSDAAVAPVIPATDSTSDVSNDDAFHTAPDSGSPDTWIADANVPEIGAMDTLTADTGTTLPAPADVYAIMEKAAAYQVATGPADPSWVNKWTEAVFYIGIMAAYEASNDSTLLNYATTWSTGNKWTLLGGTTNPPTRSADNQCAGQVYTEIYMLDPVAANANEIANSRAAIDNMIANPQAGNVDWWWADALFMAPGLVSRLGAITGQAKYFAFLDTMWTQAATPLYDPVNKLFWRDSTFVNTTTYWSRGNGWVMGGLVRVLEDLPASDAQRGSYVSMLQTLAGSIAPLQGADGLWRSDLLHPNTFPNPETSGTALFTFALAWGINHGVLDRATYLPVVSRAWNGLVSNVTPQGMLQYVQATGSAPADAAANSSYDYGVGAFLLAGSEVSKLQ
jgi:rhamnogalacturonyl hydrolase YesR